MTQRESQSSSAIPEETPISVIETLDGRRLSIKSMTLGAPVPPPPPPLNT